MPSIMIASLSQLFRSDIPDHQRHVIAGDAPVSVAPDRAAIGSLIVVTVLLLATPTARADETLQRVEFIEHAPVVASPTDAIAASIGVLEGRPDYYGTAFLVAPCLILTARHVVADYDGIIQKSWHRTFWIGMANRTKSHFSSSSAAELVTWGGAPSLANSDDEIATDWALLKLSECLGDEAHGYGYLDLWPLSTRDLIEAGSRRRAALYGYPSTVGMSEPWVDRDCEILGPLTGPGWDNDCTSLPGMSGGPLLAIDPVDGKVKVVAISRGGFAMYIDSPNTLAIRRVSRDSVGYLDYLSVAVPIINTIDQIAPQLKDNARTCDSGCQHTCLDQQALLQEVSGAVVKHPGSNILRYWKAALLHDQGRIEDASAELTLLLSTDSNYGPALRLQDALHEEDTSRVRQDRHEMCIR